jgi:hypothetical protein
MPPAISGRNRHGRDIDHRTEDLRRCRLGLTPRNRRVVIVSALVAMYRLNEMPGHLKKALGTRHFGASSPYQ